MYCSNCGKEIPDGAVCPFCNNGAARNDGDTWEFDPVDDGTESDSYDYYELNSEDDGASDIFSRLATAADEWEDEAPGRRTVLQTKRHGSKALCAVFSVLLCLFTFVSILSVIFRFSATDSAVLASAKEGSLGEITISTSNGEQSFSDFLSETLELACRDFDITARDIRRLIRGDSFRTFFGNVIVKYKNDLLSGEDISPYPLSGTALWLSENRSDVAAECGVTLTDEGIAKIERSLEKYTLDLGSGSFRKVTGIERSGAIFLLSDACFFVSTLFAVGALFLVIVAAGKSDTSLLALSLSFLASGLLLTAFLALCASSSSDKGILLSVILSSMLTVSLIAAAAAIGLGLILAVVYAVVSKRKKYS